MGSRGQMDRALDLKPEEAFTFAFEFAIFSHILLEHWIVCFAYIYLPFTF